MTLASRIVDKSPNDDTSAVDPFLCIKSLKFATVMQIFTDFFAIQEEFYDSDA